MASVATDGAPDVVMRKAYGVVVVCLLAWNSANGQQWVDEGGYAGALVAQYTYELANRPYRIQHRGFIGRIGYAANRWLAFEARLGMSRSNDSDDVDGSRVRGEVDRVFGAYALYRVPVTDRAYVYGMAGLTEIKMSFSEARFSFLDEDGDERSGTQSGMSYGAGAELHVSKGITVTAEYARYLDRSAGELSAIAVGARASF